jgi:putative hydrolase of the HAD superfamily
VIAVTFDYGQTLAELDTEYLARRVGERGAPVRTAALDAAAPAAWEEYNRAKARGDVAEQAWSAFMRALLEGAWLAGGERPEASVTSDIVGFLWSEQPRNNLWRKPIEGMKELLEELRRSKTPLGVLSNSEGRLSELLEELDWKRYFGVVADSGRLGFEKPDRRIFDWTAERLGVKTADLIHVGDAWAADVEGALAVGARAIWITSNEDHSRTGAMNEGRVVACKSADQIRSALRAWNVPA